MRRFALAAAVFAIVIAPVAHAAEPRPWLCRDKPVFSSGHPMSYRITTSSRAHWELFLMQFSPGGGHDGFDIAQTISGTSSGQLTAGRYFAVALHRAGSNWICPSDVDEETPAGTIANLCFSASDGGCSVKFVVKPPAP